MAALEKDKTLNDMVDQLVSAAYDAAEKKKETKK